MICYSHREDYDAALFSSTEFCFLQQQQGLKKNMILFWGLVSWFLSQQEESDSVLKGFLFHVWYKQRKVLLCVQLCLSLQRKISFYPFIRFVFIV